MPDGSHWHRAERLKTCIMCEKEFPLSAFYSYGYTTSQGKASTRYESRCKPCSRARRKAQYEENRSRDKATAQKWKSENKHRIKAYNRKRQSDPRHRANKALAQRVRDARIKAKGQRDDWTVRAIYSLAAWAETQIQDCPVFDIQELGNKLHVDHIRPIAKGGKHKATNLQILPAGLNLRKGVSWQR